MKSYKYQLKKGGEVKVRFYETGIFTFTDAKDNEHEIGLWKKVFLNKDNGEPSKSYTAYRWSEFGGKEFKEDSMSEMAFSIAFYLSNRY